MKNKLKYSRLFCAQDALIILLLIQTLNSFNLRENDNSDQEDLNEKYNKLIVSPPLLEEVNPYPIKEDTNFRFSEDNSAILNNNPQLTSPYILPTTQNEEFVLVPTPVDQSTFDRLNDFQKKKVNLDLTAPNEYQRGGFNDFNIGNQFLLDDKIGPIVPKVQLNFTTETNQKLTKSPYNQIVNSESMDQEQIKNFISMQEQDYAKYFNAVNQIEYQKLYQNLNKNDQNMLDNEIYQSDSQIDFRNLLARNTTNLQLINRNFTQSEPIIDLPQNQREIQEMYNQVFQGINENNSLSFVQKSEDPLVINGKVPMYGKVDAKVEKFEPTILGIADPKDVNPKDYKKSDENSPEKRREQENLEMKKRERENFPRFRGVLTYEKEDMQEKKAREIKKRKEFNEMEKKIEGKSFIQFISNPSNNALLLKAVDKLISKRNQEVRNKTKSNLQNCRDNCNKICKRASIVKKGETEENCSLKCNLACTSNALNIFLNKN